MNISNKIAFLRVAAGITALTFLPIESANSSEKKLFGKQHGQECCEQDYMMSTAGEETQSMTSVPL